MAAEKNFENKIKLHLESIGAYFIKTHGDRFSKVGTPDIIACVNGYFVGVEVKAVTGKPAELQLYHLSQIEKSGGYAAIVIPTDGVEKVKKYIVEKFPTYNPKIVDLENFKKDINLLLTSQ